jgi:hypothetical protein
MTTTAAADGKRMSPLSQPLPTTRGAPSSPSPTPATTQAPAATQPVDPSPKAPLSPVAQPLVPAGRTKSQRWQDSSPDGSSSSPARASFWDVLLARPTAAAMEQKMVSQKSSPRPRPARTSPSIPLRSSWVTEDGWERVESRRSRRRRLAQARPPPLPSSGSSGPSRTLLQLLCHLTPRRRLLPPNTLFPLSRARALLFRVPATARNVKEAWLCCTEQDGLAPGIRGGHSCECWVHGEHLDVR